MQLIGQFYAVFARTVENAEVDPLGAFGPQGDIGDSCGVEVHTQWIPTPGVPAGLGNFGAIGHEVTVSLFVFPTESRIRVGRMRATLNDRMAVTR